MEQKINIAEILKDAPKGIKLWTDFYGPVKFAGFNKERDSFNLIARTEKGTTNYWVNIYGEFSHDIFPESTCSVFPSKDNRDWSTFKAPWKHKHFEPFQKVLVNVNGSWTCGLYSHWTNSCLGHDIQGHVLIGYNKIVTDRDILPYEGNTKLLGK